MKKKYQSGNAFVIVIIVLVVALIGSLGYIVWQNVTTVQNEKVASNDEDSTDDSTDDESTETEVTETPTTPTTTTTTPATTTTTSNANFTITQWGIKGVYNSANTVDYAISGRSLNFTTPDSPENCQGRILLSIYRYLANETITYHNHLPLSSPIKPETAMTTWGSSGVKKVGDYYYVLEQGISDVCESTGGGVNVEGLVLSSLQYFFSTLQAQ